MHPARPAVSVRLRGRGEPGGQPRELVVEDGDGGAVQVVPDQAEVQVPALRAAVGALDPGRDDAGVARCDYAFSFFSELNDQGFPVPSWCAELR